MGLSPTEYHPYYGHYIGLSGDVSLQQGLEESKIEFQEFVTKIPQEKMNYAYEVGKWTTAELLMHLLDAERVFQYRAFRFSRNDKTELPGFEQDDYVPESNAVKRSKADILEEFLAVRNSTIQLFKSLNDETMQRMGTASGSPMSVRALGHVIRGHQIHHLSILKERYL